MYMFSLAGLIILFIGLMGMRCQKPNSEQEQNATDEISQEILQFTKQVSFDGSKIETHIKFIAASPHPLGSERQTQVMNYIKQEAESLGLKTYIDPFQANVPNPELLDKEAGPMNVTLERQGYNIYARLGLKKDCLITFASHYDSKYFPSFVYLGANDSASSSAALLWLLKALKEHPKSESFKCDIGAIWFDGEEAYLPSWTDGEFRHPAKQQDNTYGSRHLAKQLIPCPREQVNEDQLCLPETFGGQYFKTLILLDMIGSPNMRLTKDSNSSSDLVKLSVQMAGALDMPNLFTRYPTAIEDDHIPFRQRQIPAINLIDFENLHVWHRPGDDPEKISLESIEKASRLALAIMLHLNLN